MAVFLHRKSKHRLLNLNIFGIMKRIYIITILITICGLAAMAQDRPDLTHQSTGRDRLGYKLDQPTLVYDSEANQIVVYGCGSEYYDVMITSASTQQVVYVTIIDGHYDIIDASIMSSGVYTLELTSSRGNKYQWVFDQGLDQSIYGIGKKGELINHIDLNTLTF